MSKLIITPSGITISGSPLIKSLVLSLVANPTADIKYLTDDKVDVKDSAEGKSKKMLKSMFSKFLQFYGEESLTDIKVSGSIQGCTLNNNKKLKSFELVSDALIQFTAYDNPALNKLRLELLSKERMSVIDLNDCKSLNSLELIIPTLDNLKFQDLYNLESIYLEGYSQEYVFFNTFASLRSLRLVDCMIRSLDLSNNHEVEELVVTNCFNLIELNLIGTALTFGSLMTLVQTLPDTSERKVLKIESERLNSSLIEEFNNRGWFIE